MNSLVDQRGLRLAEHRDALRGVRGRVVTMQCEARRRSRNSRAGCARQQRLVQAAREQQPVAVRADIAEIERQRLRSSRIFAVRFHCCEPRDPVLRARRPGRRAAMSACAARSPAWWSGNGLAKVERLLLESELVNPWANGTRREQRRGGRVAAERRVLVEPSVRRRREPAAPPSRTAARRSRRAARTCPAARRSRRSSSSRVPRPPRAAVRTAWPVYGLISAGS